MGYLLPSVLIDLDVPQPPTIGTVSVTLIGIVAIILVVLGLASIKIKALRLPFAIITVVTCVCFGLGLLISMGFAEALGFLGLIASGIAFIIAKMIRLRATEATESDA